MLTSFLEKSFVRYHEPFVIKFLPEPSFYMCVILRSISRTQTKSRRYKIYKIFEKLCYHAFLFKVNFSGVFVYIHLRWPAALFGNGGALF